MASTNDLADGTEPLPYVCLPGCRFTGSTLLGSLLNEHPDCASIGAATGLIRQTDLSTYRCSCGALFRECEFWNHIAGRTQQLGHPVNVFSTNFWNTHFRLSRHQLTNALLVRSLRWDTLNRARDTAVAMVPGAKAAIASTAWNTWSLATAVLELAGKRVFVDTARDHQRPKHLGGFGMFDVKVIHLVRDPRGNTASIMKHTGADVTTAAKQWNRANMEAARIRRYVAPERWMTLHYESLCADPVGTLDRIAVFLGLRQGVMPDRFGTTRSHVIGNKARMRGLGEIREDRTWLTRLSGPELAAIARVAGATSRSLGYDWS